MTFTKLDWQRSHRVPLRYTLWKRQSGHRYHWIVITHTHAPLKIQKSIWANFVLFVEGKIKCLLPDL